MEMRDLKMKCEGCKREFLWRRRNIVFTQLGRTLVCVWCYCVTQRAGEHGWRFTGEPYKLYASRAFADASIVRSTKEA